VSVFIESAIIKDRPSADSDQHYKTRLPVSLTPISGNLSRLVQGSLENSALSLPQPTFQKYPRLFPSHIFQSLTGKTAVFAAGYGAVTRSDRQTPRKTDIQPEIGRK
jgi:hypothetical protein